MYALRQSDLETLGSREVRVRLDYHPFEIKIKKKYIVIACLRLLN